MGMSHLKIIYLLSFYAKQFLNNQAQQDEIQ